MTFSEKIHIAHAAFKNGWRLVRQNKSIIGYGLFVMAPALTISISLSQSVTKALHVPADCSTCLFSRLPLLTFISWVLFTPVIEWITAAFIRFFLVRSRNQTRSFFECLAFDRTTGWQIIGLGLLMLLVNVPSLFAQQFMQTFGKNLPVLLLIILPGALAFVVFSFVLYLALFIVVDEAPGIWPAIKRAAQLLWQLLLPFVALFFEIFGLAVMVIGAIVGIIILLVRLLFANLFNAIWANNLQEIMAAAMRPGFIVFAFCTVIIACLLYLWIMFVPMAAYVSLYDAQKSE